jgi:hypothetical protein
MTVLWEIAPCSVADNDWRFRDTYCLYHQNSDHGGSSTSKTSVKFLPDHRVQHPRRQSSLHTPLWEPEISRMVTWSLMTFWVLRHSVGLTILYLTLVLLQLEAQEPLQNLAQGRNSTARACFCVTRYCFRQKHSVRHTGSTVTAECVRYFSQEQRFSCSVAIVTLRRGNTFHC